ncbi:twin-arginine translocase TatA/TatE family subunit [Halococcus saccharolyticus]|uniref:Sec-independent protein translocase protein TatA n=1 Tax=Halococcus saccharolyticus DSM 5350 TaxID=1227455 RepID=M0MHG6_9EURY|nr:twin-arginine translocase TatA/TatE family subunit [Halococcus saccharolyticus]EMA44788.1 twin-arginine translocation protein, TatA/E family subunit [Halococcus saccharolyticus DSM 5350]
MISTRLFETVFPLFVGVPGGLELVVILAVIVLLFGPSKLPQLARSVGKAEAEFQKSRHEVEMDLESSTQPNASGPEAATDSVQDLHTASSETGTVVP